MQNGNLSVKAGRGILTTAMFVLAVGFSGGSSARAEHAGLSSGARRALETSHPLIAVALVKLKPGTEEAFKEAAARILEPTREEPGNISYEFYQSVTHPTDFATYEQWRSQADLDAHMESPHMKTFFGEVGSYFEPGYPRIKTFPAQAN